MPVPWNMGYHPQGPRTDFKLDKHNRARITSAQRMKRGRTKKSFESWECLKILGYDAQSSESIYGLVSNSSEVVASLASEVA